MWLKDHPLRQELATEIHARPHGLLRAPARISHIAVISDESGAETDHAHLAALCETLGAEPPPPGATHYAGGVGPFRLKWERHTEFTTYTFFSEAPLTEPFDEPVIEQVPRQWLEGIPGHALAAVHVGLEARDAPERSADDLARLFNDNPFAGSRMLGAQALVWTDFRVHEDGFGRILIRDVGLNPRQAGRLVQRMLELETYRMMAMLAFPEARNARPKVATAERDLGAVVSRLAEIEDVEDESRLLQRLSRLAAETEALSSATNYRFSASRAYYALVRQRVADLREVRLEGLQPPGEFLYRRLRPAMETCEAVALRQDTLSRRIAHASDLLRTRVDVALERQNRDLLRSMDRRARLQLRLQNTVEGLSVVAISYYLLSLVSYLAKGVKEAGVPVKPYMVVAAALPFVAAAVIVGVRRMRRKIARREESGE
jgi:uncharacterized membrane-anchored protein